MAQAIIGFDYPCKLRNYESFHLAARIVVADRFLFQIGTISHPGGLARSTYFTVSGDMEHRIGREHDKVTCFLAPTDFLGAHYDLHHRVQPTLGTVQVA